MKTGNALRGSVLLNVMKLLRMLERPSGVTVQEVSDEMGMSLRNAYRYIDAASLAWPVWEFKGFRPRRFKLLAPEDFQSEPCVLEGRYDSIGRRMAEEGAPPCGE